MSRTHASDAGAHAMLHRHAIALLAESPLPALLDSVAAIHKALLSTDPKALRRSVGWLGRLVGRDIGLQAEADAATSQLGVHVIDARRRLDEVIDYRHRLAPLYRDLLQAATALVIQAEAPEQPEADDASGSGKQHLLLTAGAYRITASHIELTDAQLDALIERIATLLPRVQPLLEQQRMLHRERQRQDALASTSDALDALHGILRNNPVTPMPDDTSTNPRSTP